MKRYSFRSSGAAAFLLALLLAVILPCNLAPATTADASSLIVNTRQRVPLSDAPDQLRVLSQRAAWQPQETAIIICDMWNQHWCKGATRRVGQVAPLINEVVSLARDRGVLIIHAPSGTIDYYEDHPARRVAADVPKAANTPEGIAKWCNWQNETEKQAGYPIDHSDGGCDCQPRCPHGSPWTRQVDTIEIEDTDAISDSGEEIWSLLEQRRIQNVILMGVHTNMCVLGRPFGLRNLDRFGKNVVLMRDLTDTMYNSRMAPQVDHFTGTDLVVEHIEQHICPTITSTALTGKPPFEFPNDKRPLVVFISAESQYKAVRTLPGFAHELEMHYGLRCEILQGSPERKSDDRHEIAGMELLTDADLVVVYARRRAFPADQMKCLKDYLDRGGPLIGLRTASHAFDARGSGPEDHTEWPRFDPEVLGGNYHGHYSDGPTTTVTAPAGAADHPVLARIKLPFLSIGSLYKTSPLADSTTLLLIGTIPDQEPEPVAWTNRHKRSRVFYTSLGHPDDFEKPEFRNLLINAVFWAINKPVTTRFSNN